MTRVVVRQCGVCGRFRAYEPEDRFCLGCGSEALAAECGCGRAFEYALAEEGDLYCPRCGRVLRGRPEGFEA
jgi:rRNA maturation endonuclease Nob1